MDVTILVINQYAAHNPAFDEAILANRQMQADYDVALTDWTNTPEDQRGDRPAEPQLVEVPPETKPMRLVRFLVGTNPETAAEMIVYVEANATDADITAAIRAEITATKARHTLAPGDVLTV